MRPTHALILLAAAAAFLGSSAVAQQPTAAETRLLVDGASTGDELGGSAAPFADLDGDGARDFLVAAPFDDAAGPDYGCVKILSGRTGAVLRTHAGLAGQRPATTSSGGDVDGDGFPDYVIGFPGNGSSPLGPGGSLRVYSGVSGALLYTFGGSTANDAFGMSNAVIDDVNGDGRCEIVAGTVLAPSTTQAGYVRCYSGMTGALLWQRNGAHGGARLGYALAAAGDVDGDGVPDVVAGAIGQSTVGANAGAVHVFHGLTGATLRTSLASAAGDRFGYSVASLGDLDGDGRAEVIAGTFRTTASGSGYARVLEGATFAPVFAPTHAVIADHFGHTVGSAGDWNADGTTDFAVSAPDANPGGVVDAGFARVFSGADGALLREFLGDVATRKLGFTLQPLDANGDGLSDLLVGSVSNATLPGRVQILSRLAAEPYGIAAAGVGQLPFAWIPGAGPSPAAGFVRAEGAPAFAPALLGVGLAPGSLSVMGIELLLDFTPGTWFALPVSADVSGAITLPLDLRSPGLGGVSLRTQLVVEDPSAAFGLRATNGLLVLFGG